jgi:hypothetical protein
MTKLRNYGLESISDDKFLKLDEFIEKNKERFTIKQAAQVNPALGNLVAWVLGAYEFHKFLRGYSLSNRDLSLLNKDEIEFCHEMDSLVIKNFRVMRFLQEQTDNSSQSISHHIMESYDQQSGFLSSQ